MRHYQLDFFKSVPPPAQSSVFGSLVKLDRASDRIQRCHDNIAIVTPGNGPHAAELVCTQCGAHRGWGSKQFVSFLERTARMFGKGSALPVIRDSRFTQEA
jgi:hypothetical protein